MCCVRSSFPYFLYLLQEYQDELRASSSKGKTESTGTMLSLTRAQAATGKAHVTVQGGAASSAADIAAAVAQRVKNKTDKSKQGGSSR